MAHARQTIRESVATLLTGLSTTGSNVYTNRVYPFDTLPCVAIYTGSESVNETTLDGKQTRSLSLIVEARAKVAADLDDTLDTIAAEVETALAANQTLSGSVKYLDLSDLEVELFDDLDKPAGVLRLAFNVLYRVDETDPTTLID